MDDLPLLGYTTLKTSSRIRGLKLVLAMFVKITQHLLNHVAGLGGFSSRSETVAETPGVLVKICTMPLKALDRTIAQYEEIYLPVFWHPSVVFWYLRRSARHTRTVF